MISYELIIVEAGLFITLFLFTFVYWKFSRVKSEKKNELLNSNLDALGALFQPFLNLPPGIYCLLHLFSIFVITI